MLVLTITQNKHHQFYHQGNIVTGTDSKGGGVYTYGNATTSGWYSSTDGSNRTDALNSIVANTIIRAAILIF